MRHQQAGFIFIGLYFVVAVLTTLFAMSTMRVVQESKLAGIQRTRTEAFYLAEAGLQKAIWVIGRNPLVDDARLEQKINEDNRVGNGRFQVRLTPTSGRKKKTISSTGTSGSFSRRIAAETRNTWVNKIPAAVYSPGPISFKFDKRELAEDAYIDGHDIPGVYSAGDVKIKKDGEGRIAGHPPILEDTAVPEGLQDGVWEEFDLNGLRDIAKANGTYFSADNTADEFNNPFNKSGKYTLPIEPSQTTGVFFFDAKHGEPLDDDEVNPKNEIRLKLEGTTRPMSGIIVVVGDLNIKDTKDYDFQFDGVIIVLDDLKIDDKKSHRRPGTNDSDVVIRGAVLSNNVIEKGKKPKKKPSITIKNATVDYDPDVIASVSPHWTVIPGTWQEQ